MIVTISLAGTVFPIGVVWWLGFPVAGRAGDVKIGVCSDPVAGHKSGNLRTI